MAVHDLAVQRIVNVALANVNKKHFGKVDKAVEAAWKKVNSIRLQGNCRDDYAAAEHYLYCRYLIATWGPMYVPVLDAMSSFYDALKLIGVTYREGTCPPSPVSFADSAWKTMGEQDGLSDYLGFTSVGALSVISTP